MFFSQKKFQLSNCVLGYRFVADRRSSLLNKVELIGGASDFFEGETENSSVCLISLSIVNMHYPFKLS